MFRQMKEEFELKDFDEYSGEKLKEILIRLCSDPNPLHSE